jgi:uncharacterized protein YtpQ (UPF0354 family)
MATASRLLLVLAAVTLTGGCKCPSPEPAVKPPAVATKTAPSGEDFAALAKVIPLPTPEMRGKVVPIIRSYGSFTRAADAPLKREDIHPMKIAWDFDGGDGSEEHAPFADSFVGDLSIRYAIDGEKAMVDVSPAIAKTLGIDRKELLEVSIKNLHALYPDPDIRHGNGYGMLLGASDLESSWMVDHAFWEKEAASMKGELVASVPVREVMVWGDSAVPGVIDDLRQKGIGVHAGEIASNRAISRLLYVWRKGRWEVLADP